jgi:hypothetical protein
VVLKRLGDDGQSSHKKLRAKIDKLHVFKMTEEATSEVSGIVTDTIRGKGKMSRIRPDLFGSDTAFNHARQYLPNELLSVTVDSYMNSKMETMEVGTTDLVCPHGVSSIAE